MRTTKKVIIGLLVMLLVATAGVAYAAWYFRDPIIDIAGTTVTIDIGKNLPGDVSPDVVASKPDKVTVVVPKGVEANVIDPQGSKVEIKHQGKLKEDAERISFGVVVVAPKAPKGKHYDVAVVMSNGSQTWEARGKSGKPIKLKGWVPGGHDGDGHHDGDDGDHDGDHGDDD